MQHAGAAMLLFEPVTGRAASVGLFTAWWAIRKSSYNEHNKF
jgi:hypothetical protein